MPQAYPAAMHPAREAERARLTVERVLPWATGLLGVFLYHRFTILSGFDLVQADIGDSRFIAFVLEHWNAVIEGRAAWRSPPIFYPVKGTLGYSDALLVMGGVHALLRHLGLGVFTAINVQMILWSALAFAACYAFLRRGFGIEVWACCVGAFFFAFGWPRFAQIVHEQLQFTAPLPLMALLALRFLRDGPTLTRFHAFCILAGLAVLAALLVATTTYYAEFFALGLTIAILLCLAPRGSRRHVGSVLRRHAASLAASAILLAVLLVPVAQIYLPVMRLSAGRVWAEVAHFLVDPLDLVWMGRENLLWGWLFDRFPLTAEQKWPEWRLGAGVVVTAAWILAVAWALRRHSGATGPGGRDGVASVVILTGALLQISMLRLPYNLSPWWLLYEGFPGMRGIRAVARLQLVVMLAMALGLAVIAQRLWHDGRKRVLLRPALVILLCFGCAEQFGTVHLYSGRQAEALARRVVDAVPATCRAFYIVAPPTLVPLPPDIESEDTFDAKAYLQANPDVASASVASAWEHYVRFGRMERRSLDPATASRDRSLIFFYGYTVPLAATMLGKPAVNGLSGWEPPGYDLGNVLALDAPARLGRWLSRAGLPAASACMVPVPLDPSDLPERMGGLWR